MAHRAEVVSVCLTEFNEKVFVNSIREEGFEEGMAVGHAKGRAEGECSMLVKLVKKGHLPLDKALTELQMSEEAFVKLLEEEKVTDKK